MNPLRTGIALALTVAISYSLCAIVVAAAPAASLDFLNAFFHVVDFKGIAAPAGFQVRPFAMALAIFVIWAFLVGALFAWLFTRLSSGARSAANPK